MRPLRFLLSLITCISAFLLLLYIGPWQAGVDGDLQAQHKIGTYFNWHTPSSLFPPSAIISLTDDNSTFFLARPAAFGPLIPTRSLSGQLWIGSGFGEDHLGRSAHAGELGCSDVPGWSDGGYVGNGRSLNEAKSSWAEGQKAGASRKSKRDVSYEEGDEDEDTEDPEEDDGTDDHLHHPLAASDGLKTGGVKKPAHADIQSLQESAEIAGKIVLLSRGGCGFLEKVKWVQRRGGVALIVGDDIRGGPLVTMYARGDTSNVTIPSLFTSHTTAHLLSSLMPSGGTVDSMSPEQANRLGLAAGGALKTVKGEKVEGSDGDRPSFTTSSGSAYPTPQDARSSTSQGGSQRNEGARDTKGWLSSLFRKSDQSTPGTSAPNNANSGWVLQEEFDDEEVLKYGKKQATTTTSQVTMPSIVPADDQGDGFVIGIQDWRDPDLLAHQKEQLQLSTSVASSAVAKGSSTPSDPRVDSITPGSGEYAKHHLNNAPGANSAGQSNGANGKSSNGLTDGEGWLSRLLGLTSEQKKSATPQQKAEDHRAQTSHTSHGHVHGSDVEIHDGLWVTLTPTSMSTSPLFDTLLVLVVSPLVTLTVVYALLLLRSRIRRRRWRAPKSVVERLPVRTYQTMGNNTPPSSTTSSISSPVSATTPLLPSGARPINARSRPRSRTTPEQPVLAGSSLRSDEMASPSLEQIEEKRAAGLSEWRRRYGGKQRECVVCLEEYIDGVSRVMSLPCGHEFHAECM